MPVVWFEPTRDFAPADEVTVLGHVRRRFYRAGAVTQSRTEVVADCIVVTRRRRDVQRLMGRVIAALGGSGRSAATRRYDRVAPERCEQVPLQIGLAQIGLAQIGLTRFP